MQLKALITLMGPAFVRNIIFGQEISVSWIVNRHHQRKLNYHNRLVCALLIISGERISQNVQKIARIFQMHLVKTLPRDNVFVNSILNGITTNKYVK